jgi:hypothetical protein
MLLHINEKLTIRKLFLLSVVAESWHCWFFVSWLLIVRLILQKVAIVHMQQEKREHLDIANIL